MKTLRDLVIDVLASNPPLSSTGVFNVIKLQRTCAISSIKTEISRLIDAGQVKRIDTDTRFPSYTLTRDDAKPNQFGVSERLRQFDECLRKVGKGE